MEQVDRAQLWNLVAGDGAAIARLSLPHQRLLLIPFSFDSRAFYTTISQLAQSAAWPLEVEFPACFWCYYVARCLHSRDPETSLWDAVADASHGHPQYLSMLPFLRLLSSLQGLDRTDLPQVGFGAGVARIAWAFTQSALRGWLEAPPLRLPEGPLAAPARAWLEGRAKESLANSLSNNHRTEGACRSPGPVALAAAQEREPGRSPQNAAAAWTLAQSVCSQPVEHLLARAVFVALTRSTPPA